MQIKYPSWLPKFIGSTQTPQEMNQVIDVIQNHAENLSRHYRLILTNVGGIYPDIILPNSPFPEGITQAVFLVGPGTYINFGNLVVPNNNIGLIFYYDETFDLSLVPLETYDDTPLRNRVTSLEDKNGGEIAQGNNKNVTGGQVHSAMQSMETGGAKKLLDLEDVDATQIPDGNFLVGKAGQKTEFRKLHAKDVRIGAGYQSGEYVVTWNYGTNNWGSGTLVTTSSIENSIAKRDARGRLIAEAGTGEKHLVNYGQLPFKLFETENEAQSYLLGGLAKYGQLIFLQSGPQKGRMLQVNETLDGYNTLFDYELNLSSLTDMNDFPNAYTDAAGKVLMVNPTSSGVEFKNIEDINSIPTYDSNGNLTATEATTNENVPTLGQIIRLLEGITVGAVPEATNENFGIVKYDNTTIKKNANGQLYVESVGDLTAYAKKDASGLTTANKNAWKEALGIDSVLTSNIYTSNGTLTGDREVNMGGYTLNFANGNFKSNKYSFTPQPFNLTPNTLFFNGQRLQCTNDSGVSKEVAYLEDITETGTLLYRHVHSSNRVIQPSAIEYTTAQITAYAHGFTHSGVMRIGMYINDLHKILGTYETSSVESLSDYTVIPDEWVKNDVYVKVIDANTLEVCNSAGTALVVNPTSSANNGKIDYTKWHIEDYSTFSFDTLPKGNKRVEIVIKGMMCPYSSTNTNRYLTPFIYNKDNTIGNSFLSSKGTRVVIGGGRESIVLTQQSTTMKQSQPFFLRVTLDITDVLITKEYAESVYNITGGVISKVSDTMIGMCVPNNGLAGFRITNSVLINDKVFFANNTVIEIYRR